MLKTIYELSQQVPDDLNEGTLIEVVDGVTVYCAVGWMCKEAGLTDEQIQELEEARFLYEAYGCIGAIYGLSHEQVAHIVHENDKGYKTTKERQKDVQCALLTIVGTPCD